MISGTRRDLMRGSVALAALLFGAAGVLARSAAAADNDLLDAARKILGNGGLGGSGLGGLGGSGSALSVAEIAAGLRQALDLGSGKVVTQLAKSGGFNLDQVIRIPLPDPLPKVRDALAVVGASKMADNLQTKMNAAAETASKKAGPIFKSAISRMTIDDALGILKGPQDSATRYFEQQMTPGLKGEMRPVIDAALAKVGAVRAYDGMMARYKSLPFVPDLKADLTEHTLGGGLKGIFHYLAQEEASIRQNPAARTTDLLRRVFG